MASDGVFVAAIAGGATVVDAARAAGFSERTASRRLADREVQRRIARARDDLVAAAVNLLGASAADAVRTLHRLCEPGYPPSVQARAAADLLSLALRYREQFDTEQRIETIEDRLRSVS
jgi:hypothetical protein